MQERRRIEKDAAGDADAAIHTSMIVDLISPHAHCSQFAKTATRYHHQHELIDGVKRGTGATDGSRQHRGWTELETGSRTGGTCNKRFYYPPSI